MGNEAKKVEAQFHYLGIAAKEDEEYSFPMW